MLKRIVIAIRGGVGGGMSAVMVLLLVVLIAAVCLAGFLGGLAVAAKRGQLQEQSLIKQTALAKQGQAKLRAEKEALAHETEALKSRTDMQEKDIATLKQLVEHARIEREATERVLAEVRDSLRAGAQANPKAEQAVKGALLKFGNRECELQGSAVKSKDDVKCLNLRGAIDAMNSGPGGYSKPAAAPTPAPAAKPVPVKPAGH
ncbi:hypothetical protein FNU76_16690 [Chitinimonas arctica]|uniref:DUF2802 domain-containing protein n=1 Tax=Chitinimonas arctica TaxID=2594795 RepID=A0A516SI73_9NEIS|nr:hypothetical protein [Chitinimonas arctica]QDQ27850.1 hypothetical protein FNU76_16690 [Chitinimonas arctica]